MRGSYRYNWGPVVLIGYVMFALVASPLLAPVSVTRAEAGDSGYAAVFDWVRFRADVLVATVALFAAFMGLGLVLAITAASLADLVGTKMRARRAADRAEPCPQCGCPIGDKRDIVAGRRVRTIERTAKRYKTWELLSVTALMVGVTGMIISRNSMEGPLAACSIGLTVVAAITWSVAKVVILWHHG
jgi:hypothetical protein